MERKLEIVFLVSNDHSTDQRMRRICLTLHNRGHHVLVVGRKLNIQGEAQQTPYKLQLLELSYYHGPLFYFMLMKRQIEYVQRLAKVDIISSVDSDTILAASKIAKTMEAIHIHDSHEWFTEVPELKGKPVKRLVWKWAERKGFKTVRSAYTVSETLKTYYDSISSCKLKIIPNYPKSEAPITKQDKKVDIIYQGAINEGRCLEILLAVCAKEKFTLRLCGEGDLLEKLKSQYKNFNHIEFMGGIIPRDLHALTCEARIGYNVLDNTSASYNGALPNKTFDYIQSEIPQIISNSKELTRINTLLQFALETKTEMLDLTKQIKKLLDDGVKYQELYGNILQLKKRFIWEKVEEELIEIYEQYI